MSSEEFDEKFREALCNRKERYTLFVVGQRVGKTKAMMEKIKESSFKAYERLLAKFRSIDAWPATDTDMILRAREEFSGLAPLLATRMYDLDTLLNTQEQLRKNREEWHTDRSGTYHSSMHQIRAARQKKFVPLFKGSKVYLGDDVVGTVVSDGYFSVSGRATIIEQNPNPDVVQLEDKCALVRCSEGDWRLSDPAVADRWTVNTLEFVESDAQLGHGRLIVKAGPITSTFEMRVTQAHLIAQKTGLRLKTTIEALMERANSGLRLEPSSKVYIGDKIAGTYCEDEFSITTNEIRNDVHCKELHQQKKEALRRMAQRGIKENCGECYGTGLRHGIGYPCSKGCKQR